MKALKRFAVMLAVILWVFHSVAAVPAFAEKIDDTVADTYKEDQKKDEAKKDKGKETVPRPNEQEREPADLNIGFFDVFKMIAALAFVVFLLYALLKFINKRSQSYQQNRFIQHFGGTSLGGNRSVQMVKAGDRLLIIGVGEDIRLLKEITDEQELKKFTEQYEQQLDQSLQPSDLFSKLSGLWKPTGEKRGETGSKPFNEYLSKQMEEVKNSRRRAIDEIGKKEQDRDE